MSDKVPIRLCVACRTRSEKKNLIRIASDSEGKMMIDYHKRAEGRGAYICAKRECIMLSKKKRALERALPGTDPSGIYERLEGEA